LITIAYILSQATLKLKSCKIPTPAFDAEILLSFILKKEREYLFSHPKQKLTPGQRKKYNALIRRRVKYEPVAYLTGKKQFFGLDFYVNKDVLIPRPETELIVEEAAKIAKKKRLIIIDVGTGCGCLAIILAQKFPGAKIWATDISEKALQVVRRNAKTHRVKIKFLKGSLLIPLPRKIWKSRMNKLIIANLPYLEEEYQKKLDLPENQGLKYEPQQALFGGKDGLKYYRQFFQELQERINPPATPRKLRLACPPLASPARNASLAKRAWPPGDGRRAWRTGNHESEIMIIVEINPEQTTRIKKIIKDCFPLAKIKIEKDLAGLDRIVLVEIN